MFLKHIYSKLYFKHRYIYIYIARYIYNNIYTYNNIYIYIYQNEGVSSGVFYSLARWGGGSWFGISLSVCLFVCSRVGRQRPAVATRPERPTLGDPPWATHPGRPTPGDPPLVLIAFWRV